MNDDSIVSNHQDFISGLKPGGWLNSWIGLHRTARGQRWTWVDKSAMTTGWDIYHLLFVVIISKTLRRCVLQTYCCLLCMYCTVVQSSQVHLLKYCTKYNVEVFVIYLSISNSQYFYFYSTTPWTQILYFYSITFILKT